MQDKVYEAFLARQYEEGVALADASDLLDLVALDPRRPDRYIARFRCNGLVRNGDGRIEGAGLFALGIWLPPDYLLRAEPFIVFTWLEPWTVFHPNIRPPLVCPGPIAPGMALVDLLYQCFEIITYTKVTMREDDALNHDACAWARRNLDRFPVDRRPLKRRKLNLHVEPMETSA